MTGWVGHLHARHTRFHGNFLIVGFNSADWLSIRLEAVAAQNRNSNAWTQSSPIQYPVRVQVLPLFIKF